MKFYYIAIYDNRRNSGVTKKLIAQTEALNNIGYPTKLLLISDINAEKFDHKFVEFYDYTGHPYRGIKDKIKGFFSIGNSYKKIFDKYDSDNSIFIFRNFYPFPSFYRLIKNSKGKTIIDVVSNNFEEAKIRKSNFVYKLLLKFYSNRIGNAADGIIGVTNEIINLNFSKLKRTKPNLSISNGFDVDSVKLNPINIIDNRLSFIFVANISRWHGLDRLILGFKNYLDQVEKPLKLNFTFNIVGLGNALEECKQLVRENELGQYFIFHGFKSGNDLDELFKESNLAIGNLATFRKNISITSPLKSKEYCSRGIPFFYTCIDEDFVDFDFKYVFDSSNEPINFEEIIAFWNRVKLIEDYNIKMRNFAYENLKWETKMKKIGEILDKI